MSVKSIYPDIGFGLVSAVIHTSSWCQRRTEMRSDVLGMRLGALAYREKGHFRGIPGPIGSWNDKGARARGFRDRDAMLC